MSALKSFLMAHIMIHGIGTQVDLPEDIKTFVRESTGNYGKAKLVLHHNRFFVESPHPDVLHTLLQVRVPSVTAADMLRDSTEDGKPGLEDVGLSSAP